MLPISNYCAASIFCEYFLQVNYDIWQADTQIVFVNSYIYLLQYAGLIINTSGWYVNLILHCVIYMLLILNHSIKTAMIGSHFQNSLLLTRTKLEDDV